MSIPQTAVQLPTYLQAFSGNQAFALGADVVGGLKTGGHPRISIKQARWRLQDGADEQVLDSYTLDVIIVDANPTMSKIFYAGAYTGEEGKAPDCFSDNGIGASASAEKPQSNSCAACPHNVWGSKISAQGKKTKACADYKKLAVILANDPTKVWELRVPPASLQDLNKIMSRLIQTQVPIPALVFQLSFDPQADFPKIIFRPTQYITEAQSQSVQKWVGSEDAKQAVNTADVPVQAPVQPTQQVIAPQAPSHQAPYHQAPPNVVQQPHVQQPAENPLGFMGAQPGTMPQAGTPQEAPRRGRGRPPANPAPAQPVQARTAPPAEQQLPMDMPGVQAAAQATPLNPALTDEALDKLLAGIL